MQFLARSLVVMGASGRVGRLVGAGWAADPPDGLTIREQRRSGGAVPWQLSDGAAALALAIGRADVVLVLSGVTPAPGAEYGRNSALALAAMQAAALAGVGHVIVASSAAVYDPAGGAVLDEAAATGPLSDYGHAKLAMERACLEWQSDHARPGLTLLRIGNVAGTDLFFRKLVAATAAEPLQLDQFGDGSGPVRSYIGPATLARVLACLCRCAALGDALPALVNIGAPGGGVDMADFAPALAALGHPVPMVRVAAPATALPALRLNVSRLQSLCPMPPEAGLASTMVAEWLALRGAKP